MFLNREKIEEMKTVQKLRMKPKGIEISTLLVEGTDTKNEIPKVLMNNGLFFGYSFNQKLAN